MKPTENRKIKKYLSLRLQLARFKEAPGLR